MKVIPDAIGKREEVITNDDLTLLRTALNIYRLDLEDMQLVNPHLWQERELKRIKQLRKRLATNGG